MSSPIFFSGPTLSKARIEELYPGATVLGPAECGDVYLACSPNTRAIGLIDGYFDHRLSVWHKELLWAISLGIPVYGAASMGALRAAELASYGMVGVGTIFEQYSSGALEDDDEVSVLHESAARGFRVKSDAMVNIRATLTRARLATLLSAEEEAAIVAAGRSSFYAERDFFTAVERAAGIHHERKAALTAWVREHGIYDQKRADAEAMVMAIRNDLESGRSRTVPLFHFETTNYWRVFRSKIERDEARRTRPAPFPPEDDAIDDDAFDSCALQDADPTLLEALKRRAPEVYQEIWAAALGRALALLLSGHARASVDAAELQRQSEEFRRDRGLLTPEVTSRWLDDNELDRESFSALTRDDLLALRFRHDAERLAMAQLPNLLRARGLYSAIATDGAEAPNPDATDQPR